MITRRELQDVVVQVNASFEGFKATSCTGG
jgi:hypothetical protein